MLKNVPERGPQILVIGLGAIGSAVVAATVGQARVRGYDVNEQVRHRAARSFADTDVTIIQSVSRPLVRSGDIVIDCTRGADADAAWSLTEGNRARAFLHFSSFAVYGGGDGHPMISEDCACVPLTDYGHQKLQEESIVRALSRETMLGAISLRLCGFVGLTCSQNSSKSTRYAHAAIAEMTRLGKPTGPINLSEYIDELRFGALFRALIRRIHTMDDGGELPRILNVGGGHMLTNMHVWDMFMAMQDSKAPRKTAPVPAAQLPLLSTDRLQSFLGRQAYAQALSDSPDLRFWTTLTSKVLSEMLPA